MKKATLSYTMLMWVIKFIFLVFTIVAEISIINSALKNDFNTADLSVSLLYNRLYTSSSINYVDPISFKTQSGIIDIDKVSDLGKTKLLEQEISYGKNTVPIAAKITVYSSNNNELASYTFNPNPQTGYSELKSRSYAQGIGATTEKNYELPVKLKHKDSFQNGRITFNIIAQNS